MPWTHFRQKVVIETTKWPWQMFILKATPVPAQIFSLHFLITFSHDQLNFRWLSAPLLGPLPSPQWHKEISLVLRNSILMSQACVCTWEWLFFVTEPPLSPCVGCGAHLSLYQIGFLTPVQWGMFPTKQLVKNLNYATWFADLSTLKMTEFVFFRRGRHTGVQRSSRSILWEGAFFEAAL